MVTLSRVFSAFTAFVMTVSLLVIPATTAQALNDGEWSFSGVLSAPPRSLGSATVNASGTITVTQGVLDLANCANPSISAPQAVTFLRNVSNGSFISFTSGSEAISGTNPVSLSASTSVSPGSYALVLRYRCGSGSYLGYVEATPGAAVSIASEVGTPTYATLACVTTVPPTACTSQSPQANALPSGYNVTFAAVVRRTWSDGLTTEEPATGIQRLEYRPVGSFSYLTLATNCATTVSITQSRQYRCVLGSTTLDPVQVDVLTPTNEFILGPTRVQPAAAPLGSDIVVSGSVSQVYSNRSLWPARTGTEYSVEFQSEGSTTWTKIGPTLRLGVAGNVGATIDMPGTGKIRVVIGTYASTPANLIELLALNEYQITASSPPSSVNPGTDISFSGTVKQKWSDGPFRDVESGTNVILEYAESYDPISQERVWEEVTSVRTVRSGYRLDSVAQASGFWRARVGDSVSPSIYIRVNGSGPVQLATTITPVSSSVPFAGSQARFSFNLSMSGYVGTEPLEVWASVGDGIQVRLGQIRSGEQFNGVYSVPLPITPGYFSPTVQVRSSQGRVFAADSGEEFMVDGVVEYRALLRGPDRALISGETTQIRAGLLEVFFSGETRTGRWRGRAQLEVNRGDGWRSQGKWVRGRGNLINFRATLHEGAEYRVVGRGIDISSDTTTFRFPSRSAAIVAAWPSRVSTRQGLQVSVTIRAGDGEQWRGRARVQLQYRAPNQRSWRSEERRVYRGTSAIRVGDRTPQAGCYRIYIPELDLEDRAGYGVRSCND